MRERTSTFETKETHPHEGIFFFKNRFEVGSTYKKLYIFNTYNLMDLKIDQCETETSLEATEYRKMHAFMYQADKNNVSP